MGEINESFLKNLKFTKETNFEILKSYFQKQTCKVSAADSKAQEDINNNNIAHISSL